MKTIMLENDAAPRPHLKRVKEMDKKLKTHSGETFPYENYQELLKSAASNLDQTNRANLY